MAKLIIKLINSVGEVVNADPDTRDKLKVIFIPNYNVKTAQLVYPCADLSEQISTAGKEASGTGNMKFSMNGALTIGTLDGANVEIRDAVGAENFFLFGLTTDEINRCERQATDPTSTTSKTRHSKAPSILIASGHFSRGDWALFQPLIDSLIHHDDYFVLADFQSYVDCQTEVSRAWADQAHWTKMSILNTARMGPFSSDRTILDYSRDIWRVEPNPVQLSDVDLKRVRLPDHWISSRASSHRSAWVWDPRSGRLWARRLGHRSARRCGPAQALRWACHWERSAFLRKG